MHMCAHTHTHTQHTHARTHTHTMLWGKTHSGIIVHSVGFTEQHITYSVCARDHWASDTLTYQLHCILYKKILLNTFDLVDDWVSPCFMKVVIILQDMLNSEHITTASFKDKLFSVTTEQFHSKISIRSNNRNTTTAQTHNEHFPYHDQNCGATNSATVAWQTWEQLVMLVQWEY